MDKFIKIVLAILFLLCLSKMSYGYYQFVRFSALVGFSILAFQSYQEKKQIDVEIILYISLGLLFQPFFKIALGRTIWNIVDIIVAFWLIIDVYKSKKI